MKAFLINSGQVIKELGELPDPLYKDQTDNLFKICPPPSKLTNKSDKSIEYATIQSISVPINLLSSGEKAYFFSNEADFKTIKQSFE